MKKNSGVSMISLVITIIVIIILAAVAFGSSTDTIENANFSNFTNNVAEVQGLLDQQAVTLKGNEGKDGVSRTDAQVYNYIAKGATLVDTKGENWLSRAEATKLGCTQLSGEAMPTVIDYELPKIKVATLGSNGVNCSYFVTNTGKVFVWPPYIYENELYVNGDTKVMTNTTPAVPYLAESGDVYTESGATFSFVIDGVTIRVKGATETKAQADLSGDFGVVDIYYQDGTNTSPRGTEYKALYKMAAAQ